MSRNVPFWMIRRGAMTRLVLFRHAKAKPGSPLLPDHDRPLAARGRRDAAEIARRLVANGIRPDLVLCSTALRTRQTWELAAPAFAPPPPVRLEGRLYNASPEAILALVQGTADAFVLCVVAHNPGLEDLVAMLADRSGRAQWQRLGSRMRTGCAVILDGDTKDWASIRPASMQLSDVLAPGENTG